MSVPKAVLFIIIMSFSGIFSSSFFFSQSGPSTGKSLLYTKIRANPKKGISPSAFSLSTKGSAGDGPLGGISDKGK